MNRHGLFQKGVHPSPEMRAKMSAGLRRWRAEHPSKAHQELEEFIAKVQQQLDEIRKQMKLQ